MQVFSFFPLTLFCWIEKEREVYFTELPNVLNICLIAFALQKHSHNGWTILLINAYNIG